LAIYAPASDRDPTARDSVRRIDLPFEVRIGDLFEDASLPALAHGCNCAGSMGRGIAVEFRQRWPAMYQAYRRECKEGRFRPGSVFVWEADEKTIFNLGTQPVPRPSAKLDYIEAALREAVRIAESKDIPVIGMPRVGAGYGGLQWADIRPVVESIAAESGVLLLVYELQASGAAQNSHLI
jgi:O-acetyl-ADP-ribose deacetylase (regulator of RNase III)